MSAADQLARDRKILELADREALSKGVTSFQDAGSSFGTIDLMKQMVDEGAMGVRLWVMVREGNEAEAPTSREVPDDRLRRRPPHRARHQASDRRRARVARRVAARALLRQAGKHRAEHDVGGLDSRDSAARDRQRLSVVRPRHRRSRESRNLEHLRGGVQGEPRQEGSSLAHRARAAPQRCRHPSLRPARRHRVDAGRALHVGRPVRAGAARQTGARRKALTSGRS